MSTLYTIGYAGKNAESFFESLRRNQVATVIDVRLNNSSQLAGYARKDDLIYFLRQICGIGYRHLPILAPNKDLTDGLTNRKMSWEAFESGYLELMRTRALDKCLADMDFADVCLLGADAKPTKCPRRLAAELIKSCGLIDAITHI